MTTINPNTVAFPDIANAPGAYALASLGRAAYTLFSTPEHEKLHQVLEDRALDGPPQPLQASIDETVGRIRDEVLPKAELAWPPAIDRSRLLQLGGVLIQFGDYVPKLHSSVRVPYGNISGLHGRVVARAAEVGPLGFAEQLDAALDYTGGNLVDSLWQLFITSRLHARWLDSKLIRDMPDYTKDEKVALMQQWRASVAACKPAEPGIAQDPNGDVYYAWTHALAKVAYTPAPTRHSRTGRAAVAIFHRGTDLMHSVVHAINKQGVQSDHTIAASYGNAIGQACVDALASHSAHSNDSNSELIVLTTLRS